MRHSGAKQGECLSRTGVRHAHLTPRRPGHRCRPPRGAAIARRLHADGWDLALHYRASASEMQALIAELETARACSTLMLQADLAAFDRLPELVAKTVGHYSRLDALVNNASAFYPTPAGSATPAQWEELFAVNARAPFFLSQAAAPHLSAAHGAIVNIADIYADKPRADLAVYCMPRPRC